MTLNWLWAGGLTSTGFMSNAKFSATGTKRLAVSTSSSLTSPTYFAGTLTNGTVYTATATSLSANTQYYYGWEDNGTLNTSTVGWAKTLGTVGSPYSFTFAVIGDAGLSAKYPAAAGAFSGKRLSNSPAFLEVANAGPQFTIHLGDICYYWLSGTNPNTDNTYASYAQEYDDTLTNCGNQRTLYQTAPIAYIYDNHEYVMPANWCSGTWSAKDNCMQAIRDYVPHYPFASSGAAGDKGVYYSFQVGRVLFVVTDNYYYADDVFAAAPRSKLGATQLAWLTNLLQTTTAQFLVWCDSIPSNDPPRGSASREWGWYSDEVNALYQLFADTGFAPNRMIEVCADKHMLAYGTTAAGYPIYQCCPIDADVGGAEGFDASYYNTTFHGGQYGLFTVADSGPMIQVTSRLMYETS